MNTLPKTMCAMVLTGHGGLEKYEWHEQWPMPVPGPTEVLIRVGACGLNNTDVNTRSGWYSKAVSEATTGRSYTKLNHSDPSWRGAPITFPRIQGADAVGCVVAVGEAANTDLIGRRVMVDGWQRDWNDPENPEAVRYFGSEMDGGFAAYTKVDERGLAVIESDLSDAQLATFSCSYTTAEGMLTRAQVETSDTVLIPGASGGVGGALIQLAKRRGARVMAMANQTKHEEVMRLGPDRVLPRNPQNLRDALRDEKITVVADVVGGPMWPQWIGVLERGGRYTCSGAIAGPIVEMDLRTFYLRDLTFTGSTIVPMHIFSSLIGYIERNEIKPMVAAKLNLYR